MLEEYSHGIFMRMLAYTFVNVKNVFLPSKSFLFFAVVYFELNAFDKKVAKDFTLKNK